LLISGASYGQGTGPVLWAVGGFHGICGNARAVPSDGYGSYGAAEQAGLDAWLAYDPGCANYFSPVVRSGTFPAYGVTATSGAWGFGVSAYCPERASQGLSETNRVCRYTSTASQDKQSGCRSCKRGNPVDPTIGNKFLSATDYEGSGPFQLRWTRAYNSLVTRPGAMGAKWVHSYQRALLLDPDVPSVSLLRPDGSVLSFATSNGIDYLADADVPDRVVALRDIGGQITGWRYEVASGDEVELYSPEGRLLSVANRVGLTHTLSYTDGSGTPPDGGVIEGTATPLPAGLLLRVSDPFGRSLGFGYDSKKRVVRVTDPAAGNYRYAYDAASNLVSVTFPDNGVLTYHYNEPPLVIATSPRPNHLTGITDENGDRFADYGYDVPGRAILTAHRVGGTQVNRHQFVYNSGQYFPGNTTETDPLGAVRTYTFEAKHGRLLINSIAGAACPSCGPSSQTFDANGYAASRTDWNGNVTQIQRADPYGRADLETRRIEAFGTPQQRTITTEWHPAYRLPTRVAEPLRVTTYVYGDPNDPNPGNRGSLLSKTVQATSDATGSAGFAAAPVGAPRAWAYTFNDNGQVLTIDGPRTDVADLATYTYYPNDDPDLGKRGNLASITNALGQTIQITAYDAHGKVLTIVDPNGLTTTLTYDPRQRLTSRTVGTDVTSYEYDGAGQTTKVTLPDGSFLSYTYDTAHRLTQIADNLGNRIAYTLDAMGNRTREDVFDPANQLAQTRSRVYSNLNRPTQEIGGTNPSLQITNYAYDNQGNVTSITDPLSQMTTNAYDALNRLTQVTDPANGVTGYGYDGLDQLTSVVDPRNNTTSYTLDGLGNLAQQTSPDTGTTANTQDAAGNLITYTDAKGQSTSYTYDALNRVTRIVYNQATGTQLKQVDYIYDQGANGIGRLTSITETSAAGAVLQTTAYGYDPQGRIVSETWGIAGQTYTTAYAYDAAGRMTGITYPSGRTVSYGFDSLGRVNRIETTGASQTQVVVQDVAYHPFGAPKAFTFGNLEVSTRSFDLDGRITSHSLGAQTKTLAFDPASRITGIAEQGNPVNSNTYGYDALDRLTNAVLPTSTFAFGYDSVGNRLSKTTGGSTDTYTYPATSNRLAAITGSSATRTYVHDANGSITGDGLNTYGYDVRGRLVSSESAAGTTNYQVNALGQRVRKTSSLDDTVFHYDTQDRLLAESTTAGAPVREYIWLGDQPVATVVAQTASGAEVVIDNTDAGFSTLGTWPPSTVVSGYLGANYQFHEANGPPPGAIVVDNADAGFSTLGTWPPSTAVSGYVGANYQFHAANGEEPAAIVVDNSAGSTVGTWNTSTAVSGYYGTNYQTHPAGSGADSFSWTGALPQAGEYQVYARWTGHPNRATDAKYTVSHAAGQTTITVNQQQNGGTWQLLGTFSLGAGAATVALSDQANGYVIADAVKWVPPGATPNTATWTPIVPAAKDYRVYARWTAHPNRATDAKYAVTHAAGETTVTVNQQQASGAWNLLGTFALAPGAGHKVRLTDQGNGYVIADAIRLDPVDGVTANNATWSASLASGQYQVYARWTAHPNRATDAKYTVSHATGQATVTVDQQQAGGAWNLLGTFSFGAGTAQVTLTDQANGYVIADAVRFVPLGGQQTGSAIYYVHADHLNTPRAITDEQQRVVWRWESTEPFGKSPPEEDPDGDGIPFEFPLRFPGQYFDAETGLFYNYFRDYDPQTGRYVQSDPIGLAGGINPYAYVRSNPLRYSDTRGLQVAAVPAPSPAPPPPVPTPGISTPPGSGEVIPFPPGGRGRPAERPSRSGAEEQSGQCPEPVCQFTGLATFEPTATGAYGYVLTCQYRCPRKGIRYTNETYYFFSENPAFLCPRTQPESLFP
jgi:RHS repeat-associated protein